MHTRYSRISRRKIAALATILVLTTSPALSVRAAGATPPVTSNPAGHVLGVVPARGQVNPLLAIESHLHSRTNNLTYHGGPVMHVNRTYAIYWVPSGYSVSAKYEALINGFLQNVGAASGRTSNVYYSDTQYYDTSGSIAYSSSFGGAYVDTNPFPRNGCSDAYTSVCLTDSQLQSEIARVISLNHWTPNASTAFFMLTAKGVGSCAGSACAFSTYCAYHSWIGSGSAATLYANMPYADTVPSNCDAGQHPNGDDADATINVLSHEHNEAITDEQGTAWYDRRGNENGDKCAWNFGTALGSTGGGQYNQVIGAGKYYLQQEWSNASAGCVLTGR
ncbi:MAG TPA: hypothetical protein VHB98_24225 [Chloroflexota bacterium]|nr:hypothetical protein [Chloroflexota bacterium]